MASLLGSENVPDLSNKIGLSDNDKIRLWEQSSRNLTGKNTYHVIHGGPKENTDRLYCTVPENIIIVLMAPPDTVMYGSEQDDLEIATYLKNPNWPKSVPNEGIDAPKIGFEPEAEQLRWTTWTGYRFPTEPEELKTFSEQLEWTEKQDARAHSFVETEGKKGILYGAQIFYPGDTIYDQELAFDPNAINFDSYYLGEAYDKKKLIDEGERTYKDLLWKEVVSELAELVGFRSYKEFLDTEMGQRTLKSADKEDVYDFFYQMGQGNGLDIKRANMKEIVTNPTLVPDDPVLQERFNKGLLEFSMLPINKEFNRVVHEKILKKTKGNEVTYNTTCQIMKLWSDQAKKTGGTVIHYLNSCSPAILREERDDTYSLTGIASSGVVTRLGDRSTQQEEALALTGKNILRDRIFEAGRNNFKYLRFRWRGHQDIPMQEFDELPRLYYGVFRYMSGERNEWYTHVMGTYFQQLKFQNAIGQQGLQVLYKQAVRYDYSGMMRQKLFDAFGSANKNHGFQSDNFTWFNSNPHWLDKDTGRPTQEAPHWEAYWISNSREDMGFGGEGFGKEYFGNTRVVGGSITPRHLIIHNIIWNGEDPNLLETWGDEAINYRRWYRVIDRNDEDPIILRLQRLNSDLSVWSSPDGAVDEFSLNEEAALINYKIYNVPDAQQTGGMPPKRKRDEEEGEKMELEGDETKDDPNDEGYATAVPRGLSDYRSRHAQQYAEREEKKKRKEKQDKEMEDMKNDRTIPEAKKRLPHDEEVKRLSSNRGLNNLGTMPQRPHSYGPLPLQGVAPPQPAYRDQLLPSTGSQMNNMYWNNPATDQSLNPNRPTEFRAWAMDLSRPYEVRSMDGPNGAPLNMEIARPTEETMNNMNIRGLSIEVPNYDDWFAEQRDQFGVNEEQRETQASYTAYYNSVLTMREYGEWRWQKFVCGCGSRRPNCGRDNDPTVEEGDVFDGPNFQWFLSNISVRDPEHPAYRERGLRAGWGRLSILCTDDDGNTAPTICPFCMWDEYNSAQPDVVTRCRAFQAHRMNVEEGINPNGGILDFENHWAQFFWTRPDGHRYSEMYSFNTPIQITGEDEVQQLDNNGGEPWNFHFEPQDILGGDADASQIWGGEEDATLTVTTGYVDNNGEPITHQLDLWDWWEEWNEQHPRGPRIDSVRCDWCNTNYIYLHNGDEQTNQPLYDYHEWDSVGYDTVCSNCKEDAGVCRECEEDFRMGEDNVFESDGEYFCSEECQESYLRRRSEGESDEESDEENEGGNGGENEGENGGENEGGNDTNASGIDDEEEHDAYQNTMMEIDRNDSDNRQYYVGGGEWKKGQIIQPRGEQPFEMPDISPSFQRKDGSVYKILAIYRYGPGFEEEPVVQYKNITDKNDHMHWERLSDMKAGWKIVEAGVKEGSGGGKRRKKKRQQRRRADETMSGGEKIWRVGDVITRDSSWPNISPREYYKIMELSKDESGPFIRIRRVEKNGDTMEFRMYRSSQNYTRPAGGIGGTPNTGMTERIVFPYELESWEKVEVPASTGSSGGVKRSKRKTRRNKRRRKKTRGRKRKNGSRRKRRRKRRTHKKT